MNLADVMDEAKETLGAKGVYGTPYEKNGVTVIPAARVMGGVGGGEGPVPNTTDDEADTDTAKFSASGAGFGLSGQPTGAFVIKGNDVRWVPAVDVNRLMFGFQIALIVFFLAIRSIAKSRSKLVEKATA
jgi:uncharacterized spore protein YtfJ